MLRLCYNECFFVAPKMGPKPAEALAGMFQMLASMFRGQKKIRNIVSHLMRQQSHTSDNQLITNITRPQAKFFEKRGRKIVQGGKADLVSYFGDGKICTSEQFFTPVEPERADHGGS
jgi:hypothetical protein